MAVHRPVTTPGIYFITFTCHRWLSLIEQTKSYDLVYNWFTILSSKNHSINGFVLMPNHIHLLLHYAGGSQSLNTIVGNGKRFMAYEIIGRLEEQQATDLLALLQNDVTASDKNRGKKHAVWKDSFDIKECRTEKFILQKLHYIHNNPCSGKWKLAEQPHLYPHSSALFYLNRKYYFYKPVDYRSILYADPWKEE